MRAATTLTKWDPLRAGKECGMTPFHVFGSVGKQVTTNCWNLYRRVGPNRSEGCMTGIIGIERRWTKQIQGLHDLSYSDRLTELNLYSVKGRLLCAHFIKYWKILHRQSIVQPETLFVLVPSVGTQGHSYKLFPAHYNLESRQIFLPEMHPSLEFFACPSHSNQLTTVF